MESDPCSIDEPTNRPVGNNVTDDFSPPARCPMVLNNLWLHESEKDLVSKRSKICIVFSVAVSSGQWISVLSFEMSSLCICGVSCRLVSLEISLENLVAPAKTHMQERKTQQPQEADYVRRSTREAGGKEVNRRG